VAAAPPLDRESIDYLASALRDVILVRFFTRHAAGEEWLTWVDERGSLDPLFHRDGGDGGIPRELAWWIADYVRRTHIEVGTYAAGRTRAMRAFRLLDAALDWIEDDVAPDNNCPRSRG
jgi:hypothetical protein